MEVYEYGKSESSNILIQMVDDHDLEVIEEEVSAIKELAGDDLRLLAVKVDRWNHDLSPWNAAAVFGNEGFGDGADKTLTEILGLSPDETVAFGDGLNDVEMLLEAGRGCAMANSDETVIRCADVVVESNNDAGVGKEIFRLLEGNGELF